MRYATKTHMKYAAQERSDADLVLEERFKALKEASLEVLALSWKIPVGDQTEDLRSALKKLAKVAIQKDHDGNDGNDSSS